MLNMPQGSVVVVGSINMDIVAEVNHLPQRGETVLARHCSRLPGGKGANQAVAASRAQAEAKLIGSVGNDSQGEELLTFLQRLGVDVTEVDRFGGPSGSAIILVENSGENSIVISTGANQYVTPAAIRRLSWNSSDVVLLQNEIPHEANVETALLAREAGATVVYNPAPWRDESAELANNVDFMIVNQVEFAQFLLAHDKSTEAKDASDHNAIEGLLRDVDSPSGLIITLGDKGVIAKFGEAILRLNAIPVEVKDSTGAGDAFSGNFAAAFSRGENVEDALRYANAAAGLCVERLGAGTSMPSRSEVEARLSR